ncbi:MAG TPA: DUF1571 domain-containing protein [Longimicrobium sp.]|nr:DUF1571 domain-containing protein [Longimicrobium sp.]
MRIIALLVLTGALEAAAEAPPSERLEDMAKLPREARRQWVQTHPREELAGLFARASSETLLETGRKSADALDTYAARLVKTERVSGKLLPAQTLKIQVRLAPMAVRMDYVAGPAKGRRVLYDATLKKHEIFVREAGFLGAVALWIGIDSGLAKGDTNHVTTDLTFSAIIRRMEDAFGQARPLGGYARKDEGLDAKGRYCATFTAPPGGRHLYATRARLCIDPVWALPVLVEVDDAQGPLERLELDALESPVKSDFSPDSI